MQVLMDNVNLGKRGCRSESDEEGPGENDEPQFDISLRDDGDDLEISVEMAEQSPEFQKDSKFESEQ